MPICSCCNKFFDVDDFMDDNITESLVCPDCYFGGDMMDNEGCDDEEFFEELDDLEDETDDYEDEDARIIRQALGDDLGYEDESMDDDFGDEEDDYEDRLEIEEGDYE